MKFDLHLYSLVARRFDAETTLVGNEIADQAVKYLMKRDRASAPKAMASWMNLVSTFSVPEFVDADNLEASQVLAYIGTLCRTTLPPEVIIGKGKDNMCLKLSSDQYSVACATLFAAYGSPEVHFEPYEVRYQWKSPERNAVLRFTQKPDATSPYTVLYIRG